MGMPSPEQLPIQIQQQVQETTHHTYNLAHEVLWWLENHLGAWTILFCLVTGLFVWAGIIFKKQIKDKFGDGLALADRWINGKQGG